MGSLSQKTVIIVTGPTASGKTALAIQLAKYFQTEIISADSRQCFKELAIGVARPAIEELNSVPHHFIASHSIHDEVTAITFEQYALKKLEELFKTHNTVVMVGGTGLYIKAFCEGLDEIPDIDPSIRKSVIENYEKQGLNWLQEEIKQKDPLFFKEGESQNPQRMMRALEVVEATGQSILSFRKKQKADRGFRIIKIGIDVEREDLLNNINSRVDNMMEMGLLNEVRTLVPEKELNALQTVGYAELFEHLEGKTDISSAIERIKINTRQYAKRQLTWFRKDNEINWFKKDEWKKIIDFLKSENIKA